MTYDPLYWEELDRQADLDEALWLREQEDRRREHGPADGTDLALSALMRSADEAGATMAAATMVGAGLILMLSQVFTMHPWQAGFALGLLLVIAGGLLLCDRTQP